jgi:hypothetical protein
MLILSQNAGTKVMLGRRIDDMPPTKAEKPCTYLQELVFDDAQVPTLRRYSKIVKLRLCCASLVNSIRRQKRVPTSRWKERRARKGGG